MAPTLADSNYLLLRIYERTRGPRRGDVCVFRTAQGQTIVKRLAQDLSDGHFRVCGDGSLSSPGIDLGPVAERALIGCVILNLRHSDESRVHIDAIAIPCGAGVLLSGPLFGQTQSSSRSKHAHRRDSQCENR